MLVSAAPTFGQADTSRSSVAAQPAGEEQGRITLRAVRLPEPLLLDGQLDEEIYRQVRPHSDFIQQEPNEGEPATESTDVWVFFDDRHVYISARMHLSDRIV